MFVFGERISAVVEKLVFAERAGLLIETVVRFCRIPGFVVCKKAQYHDIFNTWRENMLIAHLGGPEPASFRPVTLITAPLVPHQFPLDAATGDSILTAV
jgi:hypothetical protein